MYPVYPYCGFEERCHEQALTFPAQQQDRQPGMEYLMEPKPIFDNPDYRASGKLAGKTALITGGDSGIGRAVAIAFAKEGANVAVVYLDERQDACETKRCVEQYGAACLLLEADLRDERNAVLAVEKTAEIFGAVNILVNNCGVQFVQDDLCDISSEQLHNTFSSNIYSFFYMSRAALPYMQKDDCIINTTSVTAYRGEQRLIDYSSTKGAIVSFTRSLSLSLAGRGIRVNAVAPGPVWTPLQPASWDAQTVRTFGADTPMGRAGQPFELAPTYVYLACDDTRFVSGQVIHVNGGEIVAS